VEARSRPEFGRPSYAVFKCQEIGWKKVQGAKSCPGPAIFTEVRGLEKPLSPSTSTGLKRYDTMAWQPIGNHFEKIDKCHMQGQASEFFMKPRSLWDFLCNHSEAVRWRSVRDGAEKQGLPYRVTSRTSSCKRERESREQPRNASPFTPLPCRPLLQEIAGLARAALA
jgi:hypothetical protein